MIYVERSVDGEKWEKVHVEPRSLVAHELKRAHVWSDGYWTYRRAK
jgi:hypothetical protein